MDKIKQMYFFVHKVSLLKLEKILDLNLHLDLVLVLYILTTQSCSHGQYNF